MDRGKPALHELDKLHPDIISAFRRTGVSAGIPQYLKEYILHLDKVSELYNHERNINRLVDKLRDEFPDLARTTARERVMDAINYFHLNSTVREEAWCNYYADYFEDLAKLALHNDPPDIKTAKDCATKAAEYRIKAAQSDADLELQPVPFFVSPDVSPERLGIPEKNLKKMWVDTETFIEELPIDSKNKSSLKREAALALDIDIEDADYDE